MEVICFFTDVRSALVAWLHPAQDKAAPLYIGFQKLVHGTAAQICQLFVVLLANTILSPSWTRRNRLRSAFGNLYPLP